MDPIIRTRLGEAVDLALKLGEGTLIVAQEENSAAEAATGKERKPSVGPGSKQAIWLFRRIMPATTAA